jgi:putative oxidoreductase
LFPPLILLAAGGVIGFAHERFRRKRLAAEISAELSPEVSPADEVEEGKQVMASGDLVQIKNAEKTARVAIGVAAVGMYYPPLALVSLPIIGYSAYNWLRTRYQFERPKYKSPLSILAALALLGALASGFWVMAALVLSVDLAARKWLANWTEGSQWVDDTPVNELDLAESDEKWLGMSLASPLVQRLKYLTRIMLKGEQRFEWFPVLMARVSMGLFFAISGFNKLTMVSHWQGLLGGMIATGLPFPHFLAAFLAWFEFVGGSLLTVGFMSTFFSIGLAFAMIVAIITVEIPYVIPPGLGPLDWLDWFLYLPQVMYVLIFMWLIIKGPGPYSVDAVIARQLGVDKDGTEESENGSGEVTGTDIEADTKTNTNGKPGGHSWTPLQPA